MMDRNKTGGKIIAAEGLNTSPILDASISGARALVGVARGKSVKESVRKAIELSGGLDFIKAGDSVLLKPNNNANTPWPGSTNAEVVFEMVQFVREKDPSRIVVSDRSAVALDTLKSMKESKIYDAAMASKAEVILLRQLNMLILCGITNLRMFEVTTYMCRSFY